MHLITKCNYKINSKVCQEKSPLIKTRPRCADWLISGQLDACGYNRCRAIESNTLLLHNANNGCTIWRLRLKKENIRTELNQNYVDCLMNDEINHLLRNVMNFFGENINKVHLKYMFITYMLSLKHVLQLEVKSRSVLDLIFIQSVKIFLFLAF